MLRIFKDDFVPKYKGGTFFFDHDTDTVAYEVHEEEEVETDTFIDINGFKFLRSMDQIQEIIYRQEFQRPTDSVDFEYIFVTDIKYLAMYLAPVEIMTSKFVTMMHLPQVDRFLHALIIYFEYFLNITEFILIRRTELTGRLRRLETDESIIAKKQYGCWLTQYRLMIAREYSQIVLGEGVYQEYHHLTPIVNISKTTIDGVFHEGFLALCTMIVWIAHHRRAYNWIQCEMGRLFRSEHFLLNQTEETTFHKLDARCVYGKNYKRVNYRWQMSPLAYELKYASKENQPLLWIGLHKYEGTDRRIAEVEMEFLVPESQIFLLGLTHGILGHPKKIYNTMLTLDWAAVRYENYSKYFDPFSLLKQPGLRVPRIDEEELREYAERYPTRYTISKFQEVPEPEFIEKWRHRDAVIAFYKSGGLLTNIWTKCLNEVTRYSYGLPPMEIVKRYLTRKKKRDVVFRIQKEREEKLKGTKAEIKRSSSSF